MPDSGPDDDDAGETPDAGPTCTTFMWDPAIGDLSRTMSRLGETVSGYRGALDTTAAEIERALGASRRLEATASRMVV